MYFRENIFYPKSNDMINSTNINTGLSFYRPMQGPNLIYPGAFGFGHHNQSYSNQNGYIYQEIPNYRSTPFPTNNTNFNNTFRRTQNLSGLGQKRSFESYEKNEKTIFHFDELKKFSGFKKIKQTFDNENTKEKTSKENKNIELNSEDKILKKKKENYRNLILFSVKLVSEQKIEEKEFEKLSQNEIQKLFIYLFKRGLISVTDINHAIQFKFEISKCFEIFKKMDFNSNINTIFTKETILNRVLREYFNNWKKSVKSINLDDLNNFDVNKKFWEDIYFKLKQTDFEEFFKENIKTKFQVKKKFLKRLKR